MTLAPNEFIRRFLMHVLPAGFHRIRYYGLLASGKRAENIARARELLAPPIIPIDAIKAINPNAAEPQNPQHSCPCCGGRMIIIERFERGVPPHYRPSPPVAPPPRPYRRSAQLAIAFFPPRSPAAPPSRYLLTRFRALALFGRRSPERVVRSSLPAAENLHSCGQAASEPCSVECHAET